jgi:hypothetical protein
MTRRRNIINQTILKAVPYMAPLPTAYVIYHKLTGKLGWDWWVALISAAVIELIGFRSIGLAVDMYQFNRTLNAVEKQAKMRAPIEQGIIVVVVYAIAVLSLTIMLEIKPELALWTPVAFLVIGLAGGWLAALSNDFEELSQNRADAREKVRKQLEEARDKKKQGKQEQPASPDKLQVQGKQEVQVAPASSDKLHPQGASKADKLQVQGSKQPLQDGALLAYWTSNPTASDQQVADKFGRSRQAIQQRREKLIALGAIRMGENGVEIVGISVNFQPVGGER